MFNPDNPGERPDPAAHTLGGAFLGAVFSAALSFVSSFTLGDKCEWGPEITGCISAILGLIPGALIGAVFRGFRLSPKQGFVCGLFLGGVLGFLLQWAGRYSSLPETSGAVLLGFLFPMTLCSLTGWVVCLRNAHPGPPS